MSTAIYIKGTLPNQELLLSYGEDMDLEDIEIDVEMILREERLHGVASFMVTSSDYLDVDLERMMTSVQLDVFGW